MTFGRVRSRLTEAGEDFYKRYMEIYPMLKGHEGDLTVKGQQQHRGIAGRMVAAYPKVFGKNVKVDARATISPRAIISMMSFCDELRAQRPKLSIEYPKFPDIPVSLEGNTKVHGTTSCEPLHPS